MPIVNLEGVPVNETAVLERRPYINHQGRSVIAVFSGRHDDKGNPVFTERTINVNATLRKDEWVQVDNAVLEAARERLVIVSDLIRMGLTHSVGGLGTLISEWEEASEMTDAEATMDGESLTEEDRQVFDIAGVPIPIIGKRHKISERTLLSSRTRGSSLDVTQASEAGRAVARKSEDMVFNGIPELGSSQSANKTYSVYGLTNHPNRAIDQISDWAAGATSEETIFAEILALVEELETENNSYGPYTLYIPNTYSKRFRQDFKADSDKTLRQRVLETEVIRDIRVADKLATGNVVLIEMTNRVIDLAIASDVVNIQWASGSGFTNYFMSYAAWAPRLKTDYDGRVGFIHGATST